MRQRHHGLDALLATGLEHAAVELHARLIGLRLIAVGEDAAPVDGHAVALEAHLAKELDVIQVVMVHVHGLVAGVMTALEDAVGDVARLAHRAAGHDVRHAQALTTLVVASLALIGGRGATPEKPLREVCHYVLLSNKNRRPGSCPVRRLYRYDLTARLYLAVSGL